MLLAERPGSLCKLPSPGNVEEMPERTESGRTWTEEQWQVFSAECLDKWEKDVGRMLGRLDNKIRKATKGLATYRREVERLVHESPSKAPAAVRNAALKHLNTQAELLSVLDLQQRAMEEDCSRGLYSALLGRCTSDLPGLAALLRCHVGSSAVTYHAMRLVNRTVMQRRAWITRQFELRRAENRVAVVRRCMRAFTASWEG